MQMRDEHGIDAEQADVLLQRAERAVTDVDEQPEALVLDDVRRARRVGAGEGAGAAEHRQLHSNAPMASGAVSTVLIGQERKGVAHIT